MSAMELSPRMPNAASPVREGLLAAIAAITLSFRRAAHRREPAELSDRQLCDAGIDRSLAGCGKAAAVSAADYRAAVEGLLAAGVTSHEAIAAALNAEPLYTPPGTAWDGAAVGRLLRFLRLRPLGCGYGGAERLVPPDPSRLS
jgi:uncharacterized protein YjiS (DUF1127 family)